MAAFVEAKRAQFDSYKNMKGLNLIKKVIASKIDNQAALLKYCTKNLDRKAYFKHTLHNLNLNIQRVRNISLNNISDARNSILSLEGLSSKAYWKVYMELLRYDTGFTGRDYESEDPVNIAINYGYAILYSLTWMSILNAGLEPFAGFLHTDRPGKPSLVFDLSEPFKQRIVDRLVMAIVNNGQHIKVIDGMLDVQSKKLISLKVSSEFYKKENYCGRNLTLK